MSKDKSSHSPEYTHYKTRKYVLTQLGFSSYKEYLSSQLWKEIRANVLQQYPECRVCDKPATNVHHKSYSRMVMIGVLTSELVSLCTKCHEQIEFSESGHKLNMDVVNKRLDGMMHVETHRERNMTRRRKPSCAKIKYLPTLNGDKIDYRRKTLHLF